MEKDMKGYLDLSALSNKLVSKEFNMNSMTLYVT